MPDPAEDQRIVIAGAGYAGLHAALRLAAKPQAPPGRPADPDRPA